MILYQATPLEQAHSLFLVQQVFGHSLPLNNGSDISISGRNAVQFLTQSNVDRTILRNIWSVADPNNFGTLTQLYQFHTILRLVAMAQANVPLQNCNLNVAVQQHANQQLPLPFFSNVVVPPMNQLMGMYGMVQQSAPNNATFNSASSSSNNNNNNNNFNSNSHTNNSFPTTTPQQQRPQISVQQAPAPLQSIDDAFGGLVEVQDAPLTPLREMSAPAYNTSTPLGGMGESTNAPLPALSPTKDPLQQTAGFVPTTPSSGRPPTTPSSGFAGRPPTTPSSGFAAGRTTPSSSSGGFGFWSLGGGSAMDHGNRIKVNSTPTRPLPSTVPSIVPNDDDNNDDDFGDFGSAPTSLPSIPAQPVLSSVTDAFGDMMPSVDASLPSLSVGGNQTQDNNNDEDDDDDDNDDDFGDFGSAPAQPAVTTSTVSDTFQDMTPSIDAPTPSLPVEANDDDFGDFGSAPAQPAVRVSDAFGDMMPSVDEPLPSLSVGVNEAQDNNGHDDEDDFGDFGSAPAQPTVTSSVSDAFGDMMPSVDEPLPSLDTFAAQEETNHAQNDDDSEDNDFGNFEEAATNESGIVASEMTATQEETAHKVDDFGNFEGAVATETRNENSTSLSNGMFGEPQPIPPSLSISDAFSDMPVQQDAPLPSLGGTQFDSNPPTDAFVQNDTPFPLTAATNVVEIEDDDFGDFEDAGPTKDTEKPIGSDAEDDFGDFGGAVEPTATADEQSDVQPALIADPFSDMPIQQDAPLPSLGSWSQTPNAITKGDDDNDFGDFEDAVPKQLNATSIADAFTAPVDAPLPPLELIGESTPTPKDEIGFKDFSGETPQVTENDGDSDDEFGDFDAAPEGNLEDKNDDGDEDDEFGDFDEAPSEDEVPSESDGVGLGAGQDNGQSSLLDDPFADMASEDAPLPSLGNFSAMMPTNETTADNEIAPTTKTATTAINIMDLYGTSGEVPSNTEASAVTNAPLQSLSTPSVDQEDDMFGDFSGANNNNSVPVETSGVDVTDRDLLDAFGPTPTTNQTSPSEPTQDEFGDFDSAEDAPTTDDAESDTEDDFGDFGSAPAQQNVSEDFGDFGSAPATTQQVAQEDAFSDFGSAPAIVQETTSQEDTFGDFGSAPASAQETSTCREDDFGDFGGASTQQKDEDDLFGDFGGSSVGNQEDNFGDFGSAPAKVQQIADTEDGFGDFGVAPVQELVHDIGDSGSSPVQQSTDEDLFGDFGGAPSQKEDDFGGFEGAVPAAHAVDDEDDFGDFGSAENIPPAEDDGQHATGEDDFGDFGCANIATPAENDLQVAEEDDFGDFESTNVSAPVVAAQDEGDDFGDFGSAHDNTPVEETVDNGKGGDEDFFGTFASADTPAEQSQSNDTSQPDTHDFGDFGSANISGPIETGTGTGEFGDFTVVEAPPQDDFGAFSSFEESSPAPESNAMTKDDNDDDWGDFEAVSAPSASIEMRDRIRSLSHQVPEGVLRKAGPAGDRVDLGEVFAFRIGIDSTITPTHEKRLKRCICILEALKDPKLISMWEQIFSVVREELERANALLKEATPKIWKELREPLTTMVRGLAECLRVTRSIVASIGDVLLLDDTAILTTDTWASTWCSLTLLEPALECESMWKKLESVLRTSPLTINVVSLSQIRSEAIDSPKLCELTLQPMQASQQNTTQAEVSFQGKSFMACSANLLANRCPFLVVGEEL